MTSCQLFLSYLLFIDPLMNDKVYYRTEHCIAFKSGIFDNDCNRVFHNEIPTNEEIQEIQRFFGDVPYSWFIHVKDDAMQQILQNNGLCKIPQSLSIVPLMVLHIDDVCDDDVYQLNDFVVKEIDYN